VRFDTQGPPWFRCCWRGSAHGGLRRPYGGHPNRTRHVHGCTPGMDLYPVRWRTQGASLISIPASIVDADPVASVAVISRAAACLSPTHPVAAAKPPAGRPNTSPAARTAPLNHNRRNCAVSHTIRRAMTSQSWPEQGWRSSGHKGDPTRQRSPPARLRRDRVGLVTGNQSGPPPYLSADIGRSYNVSPVTVSRLMA